MEIQQLKDINRGCLNQQVQFYALLIEVKVKTAKNEKKYADLVFQDRTKKMEGKYWDYEEKQEFFNGLEPNPVLKFTAVVGEYQGQLQLTIRGLEAVPADQVSREQLLPQSEWGTETLIKGLQFFYEKVKTPHLKALLDKMIFQEPYWERFSSYPAARGVHHNFYQGLLQHVLEVLKFSYTVATTKGLTERQKERLIVMALLHDWAKIYEYTALPNIEFTEAGTMLGHIFLGAHMTMNYMEEIPGFLQEDKLIILNGILGHHGKLEYGSPVLPKTVEAQILHLADKMSGDVESIQSFLEQETETESPFSDKLWNMGTAYYKPGRE